MHLVCPECGAENRAPESPEGSRSYRCGRCGASLGPSRGAPRAGPGDGTADGPRRQGTGQHTTTSRGRIGRALPLLHPCLFAAFFVLALYATNAAEVTPSEIAVPLISSIGIALLLTSVSVVVVASILRQRKSPRAGPSAAVWDWTKAALLTSLFLVLFFSFGHVLIWAGGWDTLHRTILPNDRWFLLTMGWLLLLLIVGTFIILTRRDLRRFAVALTLVGAMMVAVATVNVIINEASASEPGSGLADLGANHSQTATPATDLPDIYYIILDRYGSAATLEDVYGFDNSDFLDYLSANGFFIASESVANYLFTTRSLTSSLNMDYIHKEAAVEALGGNLQDYRVWRFLKAQGYEFIHLGSWWEPTRENPYADLNISYSAMPEFTWFLFQTTWAYPLCVETDIVDDWGEIQYKRVLYKFDRLAEIPDREGPVFVFAHMLVPHPPFVFHSDGSYRTPEETVGIEPTVQYLEQLEATNAMVKDLIDQLLARPGPSPIIILQADEGPRREWEMMGDAGWDATAASDADLREKLRILNAYRLPGVQQDVLYDSISPVNSFRLLFNAYFGTDFELLPDRTYINDLHGNYFDVTERVEYQD